MACSTAQYRKKTASGKQKKPPRSPTLDESRNAMCARIAANTVSRPHHLLNLRKEKESKYV